MRTIRRLLSDWVLVEVEPEKKVTSGGIIIPHTSPEPLRIGTVKMTGPGRRYIDKFIPIEVKEGDRVAFMIGAARTKQGKELRTRLDMEADTELVRQGDILFVVNPGADIEVSKRE
jgi:co-chaperonin GroES (HSP10)